MGKSVRTVLVIEDDESLREFFVFDLEAAGFQVLAAPDGEVALQILKTTEVEMVISDINIPKKTGIEILQFLRMNYDPSQPAVALITGNYVLRIEDAYHIGVSLFLLKPFSRNKLLDSVKRLTLPINERWLPEVATKLLPVWKPVGEFEVKLESYEKAKKEKLLSFGQGGLFIAQDEGALTLNEGEFIGFDISFENEPDQRIRGEGVVRWVRNERASDLPLGLGIEIMVMDSLSILVYQKILQLDRTIAFIPKT